MDFIFNSGGDYYFEGSSLLHDLITISLTIFLTVLFTILSQKLYDTYRKNNFLDIFWTHTNKQAELFIEATKKQAESLQELSTVLLAKEVGHFDVGKTTGFDVNLLGDWQSLDFFLAITARRKYGQNSDADKAVLVGYHAKIKSLLNTAKKYQEAMEYSFTDFNVRYKEKQNMWQDNVQNPGTMFDYFRLTTTLGNNDIFLKEWDKIVYEWQQSPPQQNRNETSYFYEKTVLPLNELTKKFMRENRDMRAFEVSNDIIKLKWAYAEIMEVKNRYGVWFEEMAKKLDKLSVDLNDAFAEVNKLPLKTPKWLND